MNPTAITWCDYTWNPVTGCTPISPGCEHCYALRLSRRFHSRCEDPEQFFAVTCHPHRLGLPGRRKVPTKIFVCSMGDLFHAHVPDSFLQRVFSVMATSSRMRGHTFYLLTKRPTRMRDFLVRYGQSLLQPWEGERIWLGVSAEDQKRLEARTSVLRSIPWPRRFLSLEPLLERVEIGPHLDGIDWVIVGRERGPGARPFDPDWAEQIATTALARRIPVDEKPRGE